MTIDSILLKPKEYESELHEKVSREGLAVYEELAKRMNLIRKEELLGFVYSNVYNDIRDELVSEANEREDYKLFNMTKEEFTIKSYSGQIEDPSVNPYIRQQDFNKAVDLFFSRFQLMVVTLEDEVENSPLQEVW